MTKSWLNVVIKSIIFCPWVTIQSSMNQTWQVVIIALMQAQTCDNNNQDPSVAETRHVLKNTAKCIRFELLCSQQLSIIGGQCQCQSKAPTAPNSSKPSLQMSLRCQLKSFSWNWDERRSYDGSHSCKAVWRPAREWKREWERGKKECEEVKTNKHTQSKLHLYRMLIISFIPDTCCQAWAISA